MKNITYISAGAGSGKTYTLTTKLAELVAKDKSDREHVEPEQVILTTFTVKAANEFREKAKMELYKKGKYDEASRLDNALIGTIDSVATALIQKYWYTIGLSPKQGVMDDSAKATYINQSIANIPTDDDLHFFAMFRKAFNVSDNSSHPDENFWKDHLKDIVEKSISFDITDYSSSVEESLNILRKLCNGTHIHIEPTKRVAVLEALYTSVEECRESNKKTTTLKAIDTLRNQSRYMEDIEWYAELAKIFGGAPAPPKNAVPVPIVEEARQHAADLWRSQEVYDLQEHYIHTIFRLAKEWNEQYIQYKLNKRVVDFSDIEHYMYKLLQDKEVAAEIGHTYTHLFVDEYQDCSPIQVKVFMALADVVKQSYWVGDTKQAIYGFRGSDTDLTKAVADAITRKEGEDNCKSETLGKSWRSVPSVVEVCNRAFVKIFHRVFGEETEQQVVLQSAMALHPDLFETKLSDRAKNPLRYLNITKKMSSKSPKLSVDDIAQYISSVIEKENVQPHEIAVLGRTGYDLDDVQNALTNYLIPCDRETILDKESKACQLMMALTTLTVNPQDDLAKAEIAYLTQDDMGVGVLIDSKLEYNNTPKEERKPWLGETGMVSRVNALRPSVMYQGIGALMETLAVELDVKNIMERWAAPIEQSMTDVKALIAAAKMYENRSSELAQPATPSGFAAFLEENEVKIPFSGNGVQLLTIHGAKGLEWKYVFLLMDETMEPQKVLSREFYGIHHFYPQKPSADNLYPKMCIRLMPWIYGTLKNVPDSISQLLFASTEYEKINQHCLEESARLLYVGMTRAAEVLVLVPWFARKEFDWFKRSDLPTAGNLDGGDVLGIGVKFDIVEAEEPQPEEDEEAAVKPRVYRQLDYHSDTPSDAVPRMVAPSSLKGKAPKVDVVYRSGQFIRIASGKLKGRSYSEVGDCIHNVYAAIEQLDKAEVEQLIRMHDMEDVLPDAGEVIRAWDNLQGFLRQEYGAPQAIYHERPFRQLQSHGAVVVGSIDLVYQTPAGAVLIDFKTFPQADAVTDPTSDHYAGLYAGQLDAYTDALEAAGETVIQRFIYYPVSGLLCEVGRSSNPDTSGKNEVTLDDKNSIAISVSDEDFEATCRGENHLVSFDVNQDSYERVLENIEGHLILDCDEMPFHFYGCYFWNEGVFPYVVRKDLQYILLMNKGRQLVLRIKGYSATVKQRYTIEDNYLEPDDEGDACEWTIHFEVEKCTGVSFAFLNSLGQPAKTYILRWNPAISSFRLDAYRSATTKCPNGFSMNWSVYEWEEAHKGDRFYMLRTGDDKPGIVFWGIFTSEPYPGEDWAGKGKPRHYMDIDCFGSIPADEQSPITIAALETAIPSIDWRRGHSGELLSKEDAEKLNELWREM